MNKPDFTKYAVYNFQVLDSEGIIVYEGKMNSKAWFKTLENNSLWEYHPQNSRVIEKDLAPFTVNPVEAKVEAQTILLLLEKEKEKKSYQSSALSGNDVLKKLEEVIKKRKAEMPENSYTTHLFSKGEEKILKKLGEETIEVILAKDQPDEVIYESADVIYHLMVYLVYKGIPFDAVLDELKKRMD